MKTPLFTIAFAGMMACTHANAEQYATWYSVGSAMSEGTSGIYTASGEPMNDMALTCAHPKLPFGTRLKVTRGNKSVIVRVNDRGPGKKQIQNGVSVDLSAAAFSELAPLRMGRIAVKVEKVR